MTDAQEYVYATLTGAVSCPVDYHYPPDFAVLPCVSWYEAENQEHAQADGEEYLTSVAYIVDIWAKSAAANATMAQTINTAMKAAGFRRAFSHDLYEDGIHHKTMRYRALIDPNDVLYQ